jgi:hypothetical protein
LILELVIGDIATSASIHGAGAPASSLRVSALDVRLRARGRLALDHATPGNVLRGAFGAAFKRLACATPEACRDRCARPDCPYGLLFEPSPPPEADRLSKNQDIPRPFVFRFDSHAPVEVPPGGTLEFGLTLIGRAIDCFPYFAVTLRELGDRGLGRYRGAFDLAAIACGGETVYEAGEVRALKGAPVESWTLSSRVALDFVTPMMLKEGGEVLRRPRFGALIKRIRDRANALGTFFGDGPLDLDFKALGERADRVACVEDRTTWADVARYSFRQRAWHDLGGFVGRATFEGGLAEFGPWLALGSALHAGKHAAFGNGRFERVSYRIALNALSRDRVR